MIAGIILCGGASRRMGTAKALLDIGGETALDRWIRMFHSTCQSVTVVLGHEPEKIVAGVGRAQEARFVVNAEHARGQLSSLQCGLANLGDADAVLFTPVDYPAVLASTVDTLIAALHEDHGENLLFIPRFECKHGHPVCFRAALVAEFLGLPPDGMAREVIHRHLERTRYVDVNDPGILRDMDKPSDYEQLRNAPQA
jgi:molybdenum cofactor cytidylyltransferase